MHDRIAWAPPALQRFDLATMAADDQDFTAPFRLTVGAGGCRRAEEAGSEVESWEGGW